MSLNNQNIWQPIFSSGYEFQINLNQTFARSMIKSVVPKRNQDKLNEMANEDLKRFNIRWINPYSFYDNSGFINQIYIGRNGVWLSTNHQNITDLLGSENLTRPIEYHSHNVDLMQESFALMYLFDKWIKFSDAIKTV